MPARKDTHRTIRLLIHPGAGETGRSYWTLMAVDVRNAVPHGRMLGEGFVHGLPWNATESEIRDAIADVLAQLDAHKRG